MKTRTIGGLVEVNLNFTVPSPEFPVVEKALKGLMDLVSHKTRRLNEDGEELYSFEKVFPEAAPGMIIRGYRGKTGMSQEELAQRIGIQQTRLSELETGKRLVSLAMAKRLGKILNISHKVFL